MQEQWPSGKLTLFRAFKGHVEHFYLSNRYEELSPLHVTDFRSQLSASYLINARFTKDRRFDESSIATNGLVSDRLRLVDGQFLKFEDVFFEVPVMGGNLMGTLADDRQVFDGIACNDMHMTTRLDSSESQITFRTPPLSQWS